MLATTLAALTFLTPQEPPTGLFVGQATVVHDPSATNPNELRYVPQGPGPVTPTLFRQQVPMYGRDQLLPPPGANIQLSSFSSGADRIPCDEVTGEADLEFGMVEWGFLKYVVGGISNLSDPQYVTEHEAEGGVEADIFSYWHPGSGIPDDYVGIVEKARDGLDMGLNRISGMDHVLAGLVLTDDVAEVADEMTERFYFTVTPASLMAYDLRGWFVDDTGAQLGEHAATILMVERNGGSWSPPVVFKTYTELGLGPADEISALCVDELEHRILVGTRTAQRELWVATFDTDFVYLPGMYRGEYLAPGGGSFARGPLKLRIGDSVEAACSGDPGSDTTDFAEYFHRSTGTPPEDKNAERQPFEVSVSRAFDPLTRTDLVDIFVGNLSVFPGNGAVVLYRVNDQVVHVDFVDPATTPLLKHSEPVPPFPLTLEWEIRVEVISAIGTENSLPFVILL